MKYSKVQKTLLKSLSNLKIKKGDKLYIFIYIYSNLNSLFEDVFNFNFLNKKLQKNIFYLLKEKPVL